MRNILIITCLIFLISCKENKHVQNNADIKTFAVKEKVVPRLSNLIKDDFEFIQLESNKECNIGIINKIDICNNEIFVLDAFRANSVFVFDSNGKFLRKIDKKGKGPGEYIQIYSFCIEKEGKYIYLLDVETKKVLKYFLDSFKFVKEYPLPFSPSTFEISENKDFIFYCIYKQADSYNYNLIVTSDEFKIKKRFIKQEKNKQYSVGLTSTNRGYKYGGKYVFNPLFSDILYCLSPDLELSPYLRIDFGKNGMPPDDFFNPSENILKKLGRSEYVNCYNILETNNSIFLKYFKNKKVHIGVFSKEKNMTIASCLEEEVVDDIGILSFCSPDFVFNNKYVSIIEPMILLEKENSKNLTVHSKIVNVIKSTDISDNPILMLFSTK